MTMTRMDFLLKSQRKSERGNGNNINMKEMPMDV